MTDQGGFKKPVKVVIDGREIVAEAGHPLLQVALDNGVEIPHYCYHPKLSIDGSCRMCQVKIEKAPKLAIACNTPVTDGMVVDTKAAEVVEVRKAVMELLLLNHPLDCPICDQAGECYLQDYSFGHGRSEARTTSPRRKGVKRYPIGPRVVFDQERCILCRRCVRFTHEISKTDELRVFGAGDRSHISTSKDRPLDNPYSINVADVCPVGALLSADFHHKRRVWFLEETETVCPTCSNGCNVKIGAFHNRIERLVPRRNDEVNDTWMCDHGRLNYAFVQDETRLREAAIAGREPREPVPVTGPIDYTRDSDGREVRAAGPSVDEAIAAAAASLRAAVATYGEASVAVVLTPTLTNEETLLLARIVREELKTPHFDLAVPLGLSDDFLIKAEKVANARGARDLGVGPGEGGKDLAGILAACASGEIKVLWVVGSDGLVAAAGLDAVEPAIANLEALLLQDTNRTALTDRATVLVPGCTWAEKDGSMTNHAGRVQRIRPALRPPTGLVADGEIFARMASALRGEAGAPFEPRAAFAEVAKAVPSYVGLEWARLGSRGLAAGQGA